MGAKFRLKLNYNALGDAALRSPEVRAAVAQIAEGVADRARSRTDDPIEVTNAGRVRARSYISRAGSGALGESADRVLGSSL